jgi:hypothetical protein
MDWLSELISGPEQGNSVTEKEAKNQKGPTWEDLNPQVTESAPPKGPTWEDLNPQVTKSQETRVEVVVSAPPDPDSELPSPHIRNRALQKPHPALIAHMENGEVTFPRGRAPSAIEYARRVTNGAQELIDHALRDMRGERYLIEELVDPLGRPVLDENGKQVCRYAVPSKKVQAQAREFLADRGLLPRVQVDVKHETKVNLDIDHKRLSDAELREYIALRRKLYSTSTGQAPTEETQDAEYTEE